MLNFKSKYPIGIDISDQNIYAAQLQSTRQGISVRELFHRKLDNESTDSNKPGDAIVPVLKEIAKNKRFRGKSVAIHLPAKHVNSFPITFEVGADETIDDAIARECRRHLSFPIEEAVIDYPSILDMSSEKNNQFKAIIISVQRDIVEQYIRRLRRAGLWVGAIDVDLSSLLRVHHYLYSIKEDPVILCNIGYRQSLIAIVTQNSILARRNTPWGIQHLLNRLETNLELSRSSEQAAGMLKQYGLFYEHYKSSSSDLSVEKHGDKDDVIEIYRTIYQILTPHVDALIHEFYQITGYVRSEMQGAKFKEIAMYGQASSLNFLDQYLEKRLDIPTKCINPMLKLTLSDSSLLPDTDEGAPFVLALGLAMRKMTWL
jgi:type IV pilus assembly protein PilM